MASPVNILASLANLRSAKNIIKGYLMPLMDKISPYVDMIHPFRFRDFINKNKDAGSLKPSFYNILLATLLTILFSVFTNTMLKKAIEANLPKDPVQAANAQQLLAMLSTVLSPPFIAVNFMMAILFFYALLYLFHLVVRLLGGKGSFNGLVYLFSVIYLSFTVVSLILYSLLLVFSTPQQPNIIIGVLALAISAYLFYILYNIVKTAYSISLFRAVLSLVLLVVLFLVLSTAVERIFLRLLFA